MPNEVNPPPEWENLIRLREQLADQPAGAEPPPDWEPLLRRQARKRWLRIGLGVLALTVAVALAVGAGAWWWAHRPPLPPGIVTGQVLTLDGTPLPGARASVEGFPGIWATTNGEGQFVLTGVPSGLRWILVEFPGRAGIAIQVQVPAHDTVKIGEVRLWR